MPSPGPARSSRLATDGVADSREGCPERLRGSDVSAEGRRPAALASEGDAHEVHDPGVRLAAGLRRHGWQAGSWRARLDRGGLRGPGPVHGAVRQGSRRVRGTGGHPRPDRPVAGQADPAGRRCAGGPGWPLPRRGRRRAARRRRYAGPAVLVLPSRAVGGLAGRTDPPRGRRPNYGRDRPRVPGARGDDDPADHPSQAGHCRRRRRVHHAGARRARRSAHRGAAGHLPDLHRRLRQHIRAEPAPRGPVRRGHQAGPDAPRAAAGRRRGHRAARAPAADRRPAPGQDQPGRAAGADGRAGSRASGTPPRSPRARNWSPRRCGAGRRVPVKFRRRSPPCTTRRPPPRKPTGRRSWLCTRC
jgi:hypothetical protein